MYFLTIMCSQYFVCTWNFTCLISAVQACKLIFTLILFAGDDEDIYFVGSVIHAIVRRIWRLRLWFCTGWAYPQLCLNIWYKLGLANDFSNLIWEALPIVLIYSTLTKYLDEHFLEANRASVWKLWLSICGIIMI